MIAAKRIDTRYAKALLQIATERHVAKAVYNDMLELRILMFESVDFKNFLSNPTIKRTQRASILQDLFKNLFHQLTLDFLALIVKKARVGNIVNIATAYVRTYRAENNIKTVTVYTEKDLVQQQQEQLKTMLSKQLSNETIELRCQTYPDLIGGLVLRYDDYLYSASISQQLQDLRLKVKLNFNKEGLTPNPYIKSIH
ncbi:MAG: ATP synthase F1 subunit delta [Bacteroidales bacterium]|nr:ATP synthase F1 subunit delta [Bacteroidales bacterium]